MARTGIPSERGQQPPVPCPVASELCQLAHEQRQALLKAAQTAGGNLADAQTGQRRQVREEVSDRSVMT